MAAQRWPTMTDYQEGSVVSKQLVKNESGSVTLFAFDAGEGADPLVAVDFSERQVEVSLKLGADLDARFRPCHCFAWLRRRVRGAGDVPARVPGIF